MGPPRFGTRETQLALFVPLTAGHFLPKWLCFHPTCPFNPDSTSCDAEVCVDFNLALFGAFCRFLVLSAGTSGYSHAIGSLLSTATQPPKLTPHYSLFCVCVGAFRGWSLIPRHPRLDVAGRNRLSGFVRILVAAVIVCVPASGIANPPLSRPRPPGIGFVSYKQTRINPALTL
jgi:hypothetical protein